LDCCQGSNLFNMKPSFAIITGASQGLGKALAFELAQRAINCILVSLPNQHLEQLASQLSKDYSIECHYYETDLTENENVMAFTSWVNQHFSIFMLINNAGFGCTQKFEEADIGFINNMMQLNVVAPVIIIHQLMKNLSNHEQAYILNVSSMAAFSPMGFKTVYPATKSFIQNFTRGLYQEKIDSNVFVSVVAPGPMKTNRQVCHRIRNQGFLARLGMQSPERVAHITIDQLFKKNNMIMLNFMNNFNWFLIKILPAWVRLPILTRMVKKEMELNAD